MQFSAHQKLGFSKRSIRQLLFSSLTSLSRLKALKGMLQKHKCDSLLVVLGVDSRFNRGSIKAVSYLMFNVFEVNYDELRRSKLELDVFEDMFLCIRSTEVVLYCNFASFSLILPYVSHWPNLRIHFVNEDDMSDFNRHEEMKVVAFERTISSSKRIIIPYADAHGRKVKSFNKLMIEDWPLVQSYAFDIQHQSSREFFTLSREVIDVEDDLHQLLKKIDPVFIESVISRTMLSFISSFEVVLRSIDSTYQTNPMNTLTRNHVEALASMFNYSIKENSGVKRQPLYILYGVNTCKDCLKFTSPLKDSNDMNDTTHMIIHGSEQYIGMSCERTYFIQQSLKLGEEQYAHLNLLAQIYLHLLSAFTKLIDQIKTTLMDFTKIVTMQKEDLQKKLNFVEYEDIDIRYEYVYGTPDEAVHLVAFAFRVYNIQNKSGEPIGSIGVEDTLLVSNLKLNNILISRCEINITENIPYICFWTPVTSDQKFLNEETKDKGKCLFNEEIEMITVPVGNVCLTVINCMCLENRVILYGKRCGVTVFEPIKVRHFHSPNTSQPDFLELQLSPELFSMCNNEFISPYIYPALLKQGNETSIWLIIKQRSKAKRSLIEHVFPVWRSKGLLEVPSDKLNEYAIKASFITSQLEHDSIQISSSDDETLSEKISSSKIQPKDEVHNVLASQILMRQPSIRSWIRLFRDELLHVEASCCFSVQIPTVNTCADLCFRCGINPQSYKSIQIGQQIEWNRIVDEAALCIRNHIYDNREGNTFTTEEDLFNVCRKTLRIADTEIIDSDDWQFSHVKLSSLLTLIKEPLTITVICGPPGSRKELVVKNILNFVKEGIKWIEMKPNNSEDISSSLLKALFKYCNLQSCLNNDYEIKPRCHGILLCPGISGSKEVLASISEVHRRLELNDNIMPIKIGCVATCVDLRMAVMDSGRMTFPGVLELIAEGWTNYLLLTGPPKSNQVNFTLLGVPLVEIEELLHSANPHLSHLSTPDGKTDQTHVLKALMDANAFSNPMLQRARLLSYPSLCTLSPCSPRLRNITLHFSRPLDRILLTNAMKGIFENLSPWPFHGNIYTLNGQIAFVEDPSKLFELDYVTLSGINRLYQITKQPDLNNNAKPYWVTCIIADASNNVGQTNDEITNLFANWIRETAPKKEEPRELIKLSDLTDEDMNKIHEKYHLYPLPKGWYYTGTYYVNMNGEKSFRHPSIHSFIEEYIEGENNKIEARNARLHNHPVPDLFS
ncbi:unnamed protein product [Heterobilharzia americana]|nr:unnamed protein product [Heterobilharzia americana]